jgi:hypothetical protein
MKNPKFRRASLKLGAAGLGFASSEARLAISFPATAQRRATQYVASSILVVSIGEVMQ